MFVPFEALTGEGESQVEDPEHRLTMALLESVTLISGDERALALWWAVRGTLIVDSIQEFDAHLRSNGVTIL